MQGYQEQDAAAYILSRLERKPFRAIAARLPEMIGSFIAYDLHFMRLTGVLDEQGNQGENDYDEDEAFEYIYDAWLGDHPDEDDEDMLIAELLNQYMALQGDYLAEHGLAEL